MHCKHFSPKLHCREVCSLQQWIESSQHFQSLSLYLPLFGADQSADSTVLKISQRSYQEFIQNVFRVLCGSITFKLVDCNPVVDTFSDQVPYIPVLRDILRVESSFQHWNALYTPPILSYPKWFVVDRIYHRRRESSLKQEPVWSQLQMVIPVWLEWLILLRMYVRSDHYLTYHMHDSMTSSLLTLIVPTPTSIPLNTIFSAVVGCQAC